MKGGIVRRGKTWTYVLRERDPRTGKTRARWVGGFAKQGDAKAAQAEARAAQVKGTYVAPSQLTVGQWLETWIRGHEVELKPSTARSYRANIDRYLMPALGHERLQHLSPASLSVVFRDLYEHGGHNGKPLSPRTVEFARAVLRRALNDAVLERAITVNPVTGTKRPRVVKPKHQTWTAAQLAAYLAAGAGPYSPAFALAAATGMRRGEVLALRWDDVDLTSRVLHVDRSVTVIDGRRVYTAPKNHERRHLTLDGRTAAMLRALRVEQSRTRLAAPSWADDEGLVFVDHTGVPLHPDRVSKEFVRSQAGTGLPRLKLHELRHTHATLLLREGVPVHVVAKRLGHKDPSVTLSVYADAIPEDDGRAVDVFTSAVFG